MEDESFSFSTISSRDHWGRMGAWASLKPSEAISSVWAACLRDLGMSPSNCDVALAGSCLGKDREREVEKGLVERGRSMKESTAKQAAFSWRTMVVQYPLLAQLSLSHPSHTPL